MERRVSIQVTEEVPEEHTRPMPASEEIIDLLATAPNILEFKPSDRARARVWELVARDKQGVLTEEERSELDHYAQVEHIMRLVKARARSRLQTAP